MYQNTKSATTAGLLGIFLGAFGAHNWYLGEKTKGVIHVCLMGTGLLVEIIATAVLPNVLSYTLIFKLSWLFLILTAVSGIAMSISGIWGLIEGIIILTQGDAGLAAKGYPVAGQAQGYGGGYNNYGPQGYGQPMGNGVPMNGQPMGMNNQPMGNGMPMNGQPMGMNGQPMGNGMPMNNDMNGFGSANPAPNANNENMGNTNGQQQ